MQFANNPKAVFRVSKHAPTWITLITNRQMFTKVTARKTKQNSKGNKYE